MAINYIPNDPLSQSFVPVRSVSPRANRPTNRAGYTFVGAAPEGLHAPGTPKFLFWQCRESALASLEVFETLHGPLNRWQGNKRKLALRQDDGVDLNAFYDRSSLAFFHHTTGGKTTFSGASTDVVAHEAGHAVLDAIRPALFNINSTEFAAFHEAFGDCLAILTALADQTTRQALLALSANLRSANFVESTAEDLSDGVRRALGASHPAAKPRRALNSFKWKLPALLPTTGGPSVLTSEIHSFGRIFSGCFYDTLTGIFAARPVQNEQSLREAALTAGKLLVAAARTAPLDVRFFQAVGRTMIVGDEDQNGSANHLSIRNAFQRHGIALGSSAMLAPTAVLKGAAPKVAARTRKPTIAAATRKDLISRMGLGTKAKLTFDAVRVAGREVMRAVHHQAVALGGLDSRLKGVIAAAPASVLVGEVERHAAVLGALPDMQSVTDEVNKFVETLLANDRISFEKPRASAIGAVLTQGKTHVIKSVAGQKTLTRIAFDCRACRRRTG